MKKILEVRNLEVSFDTYAGEVQAVRDVSFNLYEGETLAIVGESGSGKSVTAKSLMRLNPEPPARYKGGEILFYGENILNKKEKEMQEIRGSKIGMIFQDPMTSLNPTMTVGKQIMEALIKHQKVKGSKARETALEMLRMVQIPNPEKRFDEYPHQFSGGMRQRVMIAMALACSPEILIADEPTTALDVTIQAQIMELIGELQEKTNTSVILVTHDLGVVASVAHRIHVMYAGQIIEKGTVDEIFYSPKHPYTFALLRSVPKLSDDKQNRLYSIAGTPPDLINPPKGCPFAARCEFAMKVCRIKQPEVTSFGETHESYCWLHHPKADKNEVPEILLRERVI